MSFQPFYIANYDENSGVITYNEPFLLPEKAFPNLEDCYAWRGRVRRRLGWRLLGRLQRVLTSVSIGNIGPNGAGTFTYDVRTLLSITDETNLQIVPGTFTITIGTEVLSDNGLGVINYVSGTMYASSGTINYANGTFTLTYAAPIMAHAATLTMNYYPGLPVMGIRTRQLITINQEQAIEFDTKYAYVYDPSIPGFKELPSSTPTTWNCNNSDLFWTTNYWPPSGDTLFWASNFNLSFSTGASRTPDPIRYYDGTTWNDFAPAVDGTNFLEQCRILLPYKDRFVALNTFEGTTLGGATQFRNRARWSQNGTPLPSDDATSWRSDLVGKGGFIDAPTTEEIISAEFIKDTLIVKFEASSWKLLYTGNEILPFVFQKINTEIGAESTFSLVPFDRGVYAIGNVAISTDDSVNVERIDLKIPAFIFTINNATDGVKRVYGIRDYYEELVYWTYPYGLTGAIFPNRVLVYNYRNDTYAFFNDSYTCFGYFQPSASETWAQLTYLTWEQWVAPWNSTILQSAFDDVVAGNQQGFVGVVQEENKTFNDPSIFIQAFVATAITTITSTNHNLQSGQFVMPSGIIGSSFTSLNGNIYSVVVTDANTFYLQVWNQSINDFQDVPTPAGTYIGGGVLTVLNNFNITTKIFCDFYPQATQCKLGHVDFLLDKTTSGEITVDLFIDESDSFSVNDSTLASNNGLLGTNTVLTSPENLTLVPIQAVQKKIWHRLYASTIAQNFQLQMYMDNAQMSSQSINASDIILHAMVLYLKPTGRLVQ